MESAKKMLPAEVAENLIYKLASLPIVRIERDAFLRKELGKYFEKEIVDIAVLKSIKEANIPIKILDRIADGCISWEITETTLASVSAGIPGGFALFGTIPADMAQFYAHILRIGQKLAYLYGWDDFFDGNADDGTKAMFMVLLGVAFSVNGASSLLSSIAKGSVNQLQKSIAKQALMKTTWYPLLKKLAKQIGINLTKKSLSQTLSKIVPVVGGLTSGALTLITFPPMANKIKRRLKEIYAQ